MNWCWGLSKMTEQEKKEFIKYAEEMFWYIDHCEQSEEDKRDAEEFFRFCCIEAGDDPDKRLSDKPSAIDALKDNKK